MVAAGPYISAKDITDPIGNFVAHSKTMDPGSWNTRPFQIVGQGATVGVISQIQLFYELLTGGRPALFLLTTLVRQ
jgi:hypothetical protein